MRYSYKIGQDEFWWCGSVSDGYRMPFGSKDEYELNFLINRTYNQVNPLLVSSKGRYVYVNGSCIIHASAGDLIISEASGDVVSESGFGTLKGAYLAAAKRLFKKRRAVPPLTYAAPQYCTWMETLRHLTQEKVISYAESIAEKKMPAGCIILDDGWMRDYGDWRFKEKEFPDPAAMIRRLHELGFKVMLWVCPFVSETAKDYAALKKKGVFVREKSGKTALRVWWSGVSALLDGTNPSAYGWLKEKLDFLQSEYGADGFKFDAGDAMYYETDDLTFAPVTPNGQSELWADFANLYEYSELRACVGKGGAAIVQRLSDKSSSWDEKRGLGSLVPNMIQAGLSGYPFCCPDMIGGGNETDYHGSTLKDAEFFARSCECAALMPMMQFSRSYWRYGNGVEDLAVKYANLHASFGEYLRALAEESAATGAPMLRNMEYEFPHCGMENVKDQFMLGNKYLVAPVVREGARTKKVVLPAGCDWLYVPENRLYAGGGEVEVSAPLDVLPYFERRERT